MTITWGTFDEADLSALRDLARACLDADGGLPIFAGDGLLRARLLGDDTLAARGETGALVGAAGVLVRDGATTTSGLVHPARRCEGIGRRLVEWAAERAGSAPLTAATETCEASAERLYARFGLEQTFAELVMRHPLREVPVVPAPDGVTLTPVADPPAGTGSRRTSGPSPTAPASPTPPRTSGSTSSRRTTSGGATSRPWRWTRAGSRWGS